jgi:hypothetical protein
MSYSLNMKCYQCAKGKNCIDSKIVAGAISIIHSLYDYGHLGGGAIEIQCQNFVAKPQEEIK